MPNFERAVSIKVGKLEGKIANPMFKQRINKAIGEGILNMARIEGEGRIKDQLFPGHGFVTGDLHRHISANMTGPLTAQIDAGLHRHGRNLVYAGWIEGWSARNSLSSFKGYRMFRRTYKKLVNLSERSIKKYIESKIIKVLRIMA